MSVIVLSYNTCEKLRRCLGQIGAEYELIVVDNASSDNSVEMLRAEFPHVKLVQNDKNVGFGPGNNIGAAVATSPLLLYLNSDAYAQPGAIAKLASAFEDQTIVAAGGRLLNMDRTIQDSTANRLTLWAVACEQLYLEKAFPRSNFFSPYWTTRRIADLPEPADCEQVMGAALMVRAGLEQFDERYFLYCEDTDLCLRLRKHGRIVYMKSAEFLHELGSSSASNPILGVARYNRGKELYFKIHHGSLSSLVCLVLDRTGALLRIPYWFLKVLTGGGESARRKLKGFAQVAVGVDPVS